MIIFVLVSSNVSVDAIFYPDMVHSEERVHYGNNDSRNNPFLVNNSPKILAKDRLGSAEYPCSYFFFKLTYSHGFDLFGETYPNGPTLNFAFLSSRFQESFSLTAESSYESKSYSVVLYSDAVPPVLPQKGTRHYEFRASSLLLFPNEEFTINISETGLTPPWTCGIYYYWELY